MLRYRDMKELRANISPDVEIVDEDAPTEAKKELVKQMRRGGIKVLEDRFLLTWETLNGPPLVREHRFHPVRKWRLDFAHVEAKVGFEIQGGLYKAESGHRSRAGVQRDYEKSNAAQELGWRIFSVTSETMKSMAQMEHLIQVLQGRLSDQQE